MDVNTATRLDALIQEGRALIRGLDPDGDTRFDNFTSPDGARAVMSLANQLQEIWRSTAAGNPHGITREEGTVILNAATTLVREYGDSFWRGGSTADIDRALASLQPIIADELASAEATPQTPPPTEPTRLEGAALRGWLGAEGGSVVANGAGFGVGNGAQDVDRVGSEVDRGQALRFQVPPGAGQVAGATVELQHLYANGPDGRFVERAMIVARDADGRVVGEYEVAGTADGRASVTIDRPFASLEMRPLDNGAGGSTDNSDFGLTAVVLRPAAAGAPPAETPPPATPAPTPPAEGTPPAGSTDARLALIEDLLRAAAAETDPEDKIALIRAALALLDDLVEEGGAGAPGAPGGEAPGGETPGTAPGTGPGTGPGGPPAAEPTALSGQALREWLRAEGGSLGEKDGAFGVANGARGVDRAGAEIDRGQAVFFTVPDGQGEIAGATVELKNLYAFGPDGDRVETATVVARDAAGRIVGEYDVRGTENGIARLQIDVPFASLEFRPSDNGAGGSSNNSDFGVNAITLNPAQAGAPTGPDAGAAPAPGGDAGSERAQLLAQAVALLRQLLNLIESGVADPAMQSRMLDQVMQLLSQFTAMAGADAAETEG